MWKVIRASVIGTSHVESQLPCQDSCFAEVIPGRDRQDYLVVVVSDGAGSAKQGGEGAELACSTAAASIAATLENSADIRLLEEAPAEEWINDIRRAIYKRAEVAELAARDFACTLIGAVIGLNHAIFFQIGDGAIVATCGSTQGVVFWPDSGPYANMTYFVTDEDALTHLHVQVTKSAIDEIAVFSDGVQRLALSFESQTPHIPFFDPMFSILRKQLPETCDALDSRLAQFLDSAPVNERTNDDKTLVLATRRTE